MFEIQKNEISDELIELFIENTPIAYIVLDEERRIQYINNSFMKLRNLSISDVLNQPCYNFSNGGVPCKVCAVEQTIKSGNKSFVQRKDVLENGNIRYIDDYSIPLKSKNVNGKNYILEIMIDRSKEMMVKKKLDEDFAEIIKIMIELLESKDSYTANHSKSVGRIANQISKKMNLSEDEVYDITIAALLHDIGKVKISNKIINKPGKLTDEEFKSIKTHSQKSYDMIKNLKSLESISKMVLDHHERIDGKGYPNGLKDKEISLGSKIIAVADTYDAMTSSRSYRSALSHQVAVNEMKRVSGTQLDSEVLEVFFKLDHQKLREKMYLKNDKEDDIIDRKLFSYKQLYRREQEINKNNFSFSEFDKHDLLKQIFNNTPCGYVLMDVDMNVLYTSPYFNEFMGVDGGAVIGTKCYSNVADRDSPCLNCVVKEALKNKRSNHRLVEQKTKNGLKIFDAYGVPLLGKKGTVDYLMEVIIDRTEEQLIQRTRYDDYKHLALMLGDVLKHMGMTGEDIEVQTIIPELRSKIISLMSE